MNNTDIIGKIVVEGQLLLTSPLLIGSGRSQEVLDCEVVKDRQGYPYIPGTSFAGALRSYSHQWLLEPTEEQAFWGCIRDKQAQTLQNGDKQAQIRQSAVAVSDVRLEKVQMAVRDGVRLREDTGVAATGGKYNYEVVEPGAIAHFALEITLRAGDDKERFLQMAAFLLQGLQAGRICLGAMTTKGFGESRLLEETSICRVYDFCQPGHLLAWLSKEPAAVAPIDILALSVAGKRTAEFTVDARFALKSSLLVRSYNTPEVEGASDAVQLQSGGRWVIPGSSIKGALRAQARNILVALGVEQKLELKLKELFGFAEEGKLGKKQKSRFVVKECYFTEAEEVQHNRIRIDRFTGGVMKTALFNTSPVWCLDDREVFQLRLSISSYAKWEVGLLLLLLKDLWTGMLPLGGEKAVGRGVLQGLRASLSDGEHRWEVVQEGTALHVQGDGQALEAFVAAFAELAEKGGGHHG